MLENLRNQERLSAEEEERIDSKIRIFILVLMGAAIAIILWMILGKKTIGKMYYVGILTLLAVVWLVKYVLGTFLKHSLAQRTDEQVSAYLKAAGLELAAYIGLGWFFVAMQGNAILGAAIYVFGLTTSRKQRDIYYGISEEAGESASTDQTEKTDPEQESLTDSESTYPEDEDGMKPESDPLSIPDTLPSAADRQQREEEKEDGSV